MPDEKPWLKNYPSGVPAEISLQAQRTIPDILRGAVADYAQKPAFSNLGRSLTYAELDRLSADFAGYLAGQLKLGKGDRVAIMLPNCLQYPVVLFGILRAGLTVVNVNPLYTVRELQYQLADAGASAIVAFNDCYPVLQQALPQTRVRQVILTGSGDPLAQSEALRPPEPPPHGLGAVELISLPAALQAGASQPPANIPLSANDIAFLQYTGGTTGVSKGAVLSHGNLVANVAQVRLWFSGTGKALLPGAERVITALPLYHIFALMANCLLFMELGAHNHLIGNPRDLPAMVKEMGQLGFTAISGVNTLFNGLLHTPGFDELDFSSLKWAMAGGMALQRATALRWKATTGVTLLEGYGVTETSPVACVNPFDLAEYNGSIGLPVPSTEVCVKDDDNRVLAIGESGELCIRGPQVMQGYWQKPEETAQALDADGWLHTGDIARIDETGFVYIVDRKKDMILVSGFNVYPNEVEDVIAHMPGVLEVAAIGQPDEKSGEVVKVVIVKKDPNLSAAEVIAFTKDKLTGYKQPRIVEFRDSLPKTGVGKILRRELRGA